MRGVLVSAAVLVSALSVGHETAASAGAVSCVAQPVMHLPGFPEQVVYGDGPAVLVEVGGERGARISIAQSTPDNEGWRGQKTPWLVRDSYHGPLTITGRRVDREGEVRFARGYGQHLRTLTFERDDRNPAVHGYYELPAEALFRSPGCYAFQATGNGFQERLVVRVIG
jgi:hypothetical protein